jgi:hypothetical protein
VRDRCEWAAAQAEDLCAHGEWRIAFEDLLANLHEQGVVLTAAELDDAETLSSDVRLSRRMVAALEGLHVDQEGRQRAVVLTVAHVENDTELRRLVGAALALRPHHEHDWSAFSAAVAVAAMPHLLQIWGWEKLSGERPDDAQQLLSVLHDAMRARAVSVELYTSEDEPVGPSVG